MATAAARPTWTSLKLKLSERKSLSYPALALFTSLYHWRPEGVIPGVVWRPRKMFRNGECGPNILGREPLMNDAVSGVELCAE